MHGFAPKELIAPGILMTVVVREINDSLPLLLYVHHGNMTCMCAVNSRSCKRIWMTLLEIRSILRFMGHSALIFGPFDRVFT